jgi:hypothetical protein
MDLLFQTEERKAVPARGFTSLATGEGSDPPELLPASMLPGAIVNPSNSIQIGGVAGVRSLHSRLDSSGQKGQDARPSRAAYSNY